MPGMKVHNEFDFFLPLQSEMGILSDNNAFDGLEKSKSIPFIPIQNSERYIVIQFYCKQYY